MLNILTWKKIPEEIISKILYFYIITKAIYKYLLPSFCLRVRHKIIHLKSKWEKVVNSDCHYNYYYYYYYYTHHSGCERYSTVDMIWAETHWGPWAPWAGTSALAIGRGVSLSRICPLVPLTSWSVVMGKWEEHLYCLPEWNRARLLWQRRVLMPGLKSRPVWPHCPLSHWES